VKILVVGGGGREHALVRKLKESLKVTEIHCAPGNAGIAADAVCVDIKATDVKAMVAYAVEQAFDLVVVAPDDPLCLGMVDALEARGIAAFGPNRAAAAIEGSKVFAKELMQKYAIPTAAHQTFEETSRAIAYIREQNSWPCVIKADGLALGKGVVIAQNLDEAEEAVRRMMEDKIFGESGSRIVVEEFLTGPEVSVLAFCDGKTVVPMVSSMDHKRAYDNNQGPNTGGMGAIAPNPHYTSEMAERCMGEIFLPTVQAMAQEGRPFRGCLYFGLMLTSAGPKVIEYNCRFGDPETQVVLPLLESDLLDIMLATRNGTLADTPVVWKQGAAACVVLASGGYPGSYPVGVAIQGLEENGQVAQSDAVIYHAGTRKAGTSFVTAGGRVMGVTAVGATLEDALQTAYQAAQTISFSGMHYRRDIGRY
jgi:phosphoribosylamine--glycine ligase